ncbi:single-strand selective monofunctional uracil DNA glycosylase [Topomyia yanbarensis]|uniref:single-strand selective monofunctional uracil DNA glycosylase n=1 Tax=Topomyia yanbarensis TaxID=2498891 RepID=UPI00273B085B|nr:single-strand selective monofunctional uracil DNA glycosylase [Topomyia yanbarensis]
MLRNKLKLSDQSEVAPPSEFSLAQFNNELKPKLESLNVTAPNDVSLSGAGCKAQPSSETDQQPLWQRVYQLELQLCDALKQIPLPASAAVTYDPIEYAVELHLAYMQRYLDGPKPVLFLGMNPGPWGMCQTGVPFGYIPAVRDWMQLRGQVLKPIPELSVRPVEGLACTRGEQSGQRWWGLYERICGKPENFFRNCFVFNICPLAFFQANGRNITPADLKGTSKTRMQEVCTEYLQSALELFNPSIIISVGRYTEDRVKALVRQNLLDATRVQLKCMPHPSPRSLNNTNWHDKAQQWLEDNGVMPYLKA